MKIYSIVDSKVGIRNVVMYHTDAEAIRALRMGIESGQLKDVARDLLIYRFADVTDIDEGNIVTQKIDAYRQELIATGANIILELKGEKNENKDQTEG